MLPSTGTSFKCYPSQSFTYWLKFPIDELQRFGGKRRVRKMRGVENVEQILIFHFNYNFPFQFR